MRRTLLQRLVLLSICSTLLSPRTVFAAEGLESNSTFNTVGKMSAVNQVLKEKHLHIVESSQPHRIGILLDGESLPMKGTLFIEKYRTMVPVRDLVESFGAQFKWYKEQQIVLIISDTFFMELVIGKADAKVIQMNKDNLTEETIHIEVPVRVVNEVVFVPGRFIAEAFGAHVEWDKSLNSMVITTTKEYENQNGEMGELTATELVKRVVNEFGKNLQMVSLLAPEAIVVQSLEKFYSDYVTKELLEKWKMYPEIAPGRLVSSPWPDRIDILSVTEVTETEYTVKGEIIELTSVDFRDKKEEIAAKKSITLQVIKIDDQWVISDVTVGEY